MLAQPPNVKKRLKKDYALLTKLRKGKVTVRGGEGRRTYTYRKPKMSKNLQRAFKKKSKFTGNIKIKSPRAIRKGMKQYRKKAITIRKDRFKYRKMLRKIAAYHGKTKVKRDRKRERQLAQYRKKKGKPNKASRIFSLKFLFKPKRKVKNPPYLRKRIKYKYDPGEKDLWQH